MLGVVTKLANDPVLLDQVYVVSLGSLFPLIYGTLPSWIVREVAPLMVPARNGQKMEYFLVVFVYEKLKHAVLPESENNMTDVFIKKDVEEVIVNPAP